MNSETFFTEDEYYETPEEIVEAYYNGNLEENYPIMVEAIDILIRENNRFGIRFLRKKYHEGPHFAKAQCS